MSNLVEKFKKNQKKQDIDWEEVDRALKEIIGEKDFNKYKEANKIRLQLIKFLKEEEA